MNLLVFGSGGSEGIPVPFCNCRLCKSGERRRRAGYVIETSGINLWLEASPDLREQLIDYGKLIDYLYISHIHYDHTGGLNDLRQALVVGCANGYENKKLKLLIPFHLHEEFISNKCKNIRESVYHSFQNLLSCESVEVISIKPMTWIRLNEKVKVVIADTAHSNTLSSSILVKDGKKSLLYLADADMLDENLHRITEHVKNIDIVLAHTPF
ncbi:MAG: hypothetical protein DRP11_03685, partial [Candidatus Aenigmatarchaeota archaeon]